MESEVVLRRHLLIWRDPPPWPFLPRGLLPLVALALAAAFALGPLARQWIEAPVQRETRAELDAAGYRWVRVAVSGQSITLSGEAPTAEAGNRALALARAATCPTWIGRRTCAVSVAGNFTVAPPEVAAVTPAAAALAAAAPVTAAGTAPLTAALPAVTPAAARRCERSLAGLMRREQIDFRFGSAAIAKSSAALLDRLARQVRDCPGSIRIEGFTDNVGRAAVNQALSAARAAAVREALIARGIPAQRLESQGLGAAHPIASNRTAKGRARNRRIEFHVDMNPA
jgi:outer membrane protein OmpA-like peptidoglycan-associated protein